MVIEILLLPQRVTMKPYAIICILFFHQYKYSNFFLNHANTSNRTTTHPLTNRVGNTYITRVNTYNITD